MIIQTSTDLVSSILQDEIGSGYFEEEAGSASNDLSLLVDDEDFQSSPVRIPVECKVPAHLQVICSTVMSCVFARKNMFPYHVVGFRPIRVQT